MRNHPSNELGLSAVPLAEGGLTPETCRPCEERTRRNAPVAKVGAHVVGAGEGVLQGDYPRSRPSWRSCFKEGQVTSVSTVG